MLIASHSSLGSVNAGPIEFKGKGRNKKHSPEKQAVPKKSALENKAALPLANQTSPKAVHMVGLELTAPHTSPRQWRGEDLRAVPHPRNQRHVSHPGLTLWQGTDEKLEN